MPAPPYGNDGEWRELSGFVIPGGDIDAAQPGGPLRYTGRSCGRKPLETRGLRAGPGGPAPQGNERSRLCTRPAAGRRTF
jgi:hypothetical protein